MENNKFYPSWILDRLDVFIRRAMIKGIDLDKIDGKLKDKKRFSLIYLFLDSETRGLVFSLAPIFFDVYIYPKVYYLFVTLLCWPLFRETVWVCNVPPSKRKLVKNYLKGNWVRFMPNAYSPFFIDSAIRYSRCKRFVIWGVGEKLDFSRYALINNISIVRVEDGFFCSTEFGDGKALSYSLVFDGKGLHFDSSKPSDIEEILSTYDFSGAQDLLNRARHCISQINKFNFVRHNRSSLSNLRFPEKIVGSKRILVLGQSDNDLSVPYGSTQVTSNAALLEIAICENPDAEIFYRPDPDFVVNGKSKLSSLDTLLSKVTFVIPPDVSLQDSFCDIDRVYTMTSLAGIDALLRGVPVTVMGAPFYSGWGLTDDRQSIPRRRRKLALDEMFAAAYLLYAKYRDPETGVALQLEDVIDKFIELEKNAGDLSDLSSNSFLDGCYINLKSRKEILGRFCIGNDRTSVALVSDSIGVIRDAIELCQRGKTVNVFFVREVHANNPNINIPPWLRDRIFVYSLAKRYGSAFSNVEQSAVKIGETVCHAFELILKDLVGDAICADGLSAGLDDFIYADALRFSAMREVLAEHECVLICCDLNNVTASVFYSSVFHSRMLGKESAVYFNENSSDFLCGLDKNGIDIFADGVLDADTRTGFLRLLNETLSVFRSVNNDIDMFGGICGNVLGGNYAYSPSAFHLLNCITSEFKELKLLYIPTARGNISTFEQNKAQIFQHAHSPNVTVYPGSNEYYSRLLGGALPELQSYANDIISKVLKKHLSLLLPSLVVDGIFPSLRNFSQTFVSNLVFAADITGRSGKMLFFGTTMDRSPWSRIVNAIAQKKGIPTFGLQPQLMSASCRYKAPVVDKFGAIDSAQVDVIRSLGRDGGIGAVGSVNLLARLQSIASFMGMEAHDTSRKTIIFMMQHSNTEQMLMIASSLANTCRNYNYRLIVKPHPHQERQVLEQVREVLKDLKFSEVLDPSENTYKALARSNIVVGLYSSTLYEAALSGFDVVIANFAQPLDESIDFSRFGIAVKVTQTSEFEGVIKDIAEGGDISKRLKIGRGDYISNNPQFKPPFDFSFIDNFVYSSISVAVCASAREVI